MAFYTPYKAKIDLDGLWSALAYARQREATERREAKADERYSAAMERDEARYQDTVAYRDKTDMKDDTRYKETLDWRKRLEDKSDRRYDEEIKREETRYADARSDKQATIALEKQRYEESNVKEIADLILREKQDAYTEDSTERLAREAYHSGNKEKQERARALYGGVYNRVEKAEKLAEVAFNQALIKDQVASEQSNVLMHELKKQGRTQSHEPYVDLFNKMRYGATASAMVMLDNAINDGAIDEAARTAILNSAGGGEGGNGKLNVEVVLSLFAEIVDPKKMDDKLYKDMATVEAQHDAVKKYAEDYSTQLSSVIPAVKPRSGQPASSPVKLDSTNFAKAVHLYQRDKALFNRVGKYSAGDPATLYAHARKLKMSPEALLSRINSLVASGRLGKTGVSAFDIRSKLVYNELSLIGDLLAR